MTPFSKIGKILIVLTIPGLILSILYLIIIYDELPNRIPFRIDYRENVNE